MGFFSSAIGGGTGGSGSCSCNPNDVVNMQNQIHEIEDMLLQLQINLESQEGNLGTVVSEVASLKSVDTGIKADVENLKQTSLKAKVVE